MTPPSRFERFLHNFNFELPHSTPYPLLNPLEPALRPIQCELAPESQGLVLCRRDNPSVIGSLYRPVNSYFPDYDPEAFFAQLPSRVWQIGAQNSNEPSFARSGFSDFFSQWKTDCRQFVEFSWWRDASTGQRALGLGIALVGGVAIAGSVALLGGGASALLAAESLGSATLGSAALQLGASVLAHETLYLGYRIATETPDSSQHDDRLAVLIDLARAELEEWRLDRNSHRNFGALLLSAEIALKRPPLGTAIEDRYWDSWNALVQRVQRASREVQDPFEALVRFRRQLYLYGQTGHYKLRLSGLLGMLDGRGGNCAARALITLSMMEVSGIRLPSPWVVGLQPFRGHVEAIAYNPQTKETLNLRTGNAGRELSAPLYHPYVLLDGFLRARRETSPVSLQDLLLYPADRPLAGTGGSGNEVLEIVPGNEALLEFPDSPYPFEGSTPEEAFDPPPQSVARPGEQALDGTGVSGRNSGNLHSLAWEDGNRMFLQAFEEEFSNPNIQFNLIGDLLFFRTRMDSNFYNSLDSEEQRYAALAGVFSRELQAFFSANQSVRRDFHRLASSPEDILSLSRRDLRSMVSFISEVNGYIRVKWTSSLARLGLTRFFDFDRWEVFGPEYAEIVEDARDVINWIESNPTEFLESISRQSAENSEQLVMMLDFLSRISSRRFINLPRTALSMRPQIRGNNRPAPEPSGLPRINLPVAHQSIPIELWSQDSMGRSGISISRDRRPAQDPGISLGNLVLIAYSFGGELADAHPIFREWDEAMTREFLRENSGGAYDFLVPFLLRVVMNRKYHIAFERIDENARNQIRNYPELEPIVVQTYERRR